MITLTPHQTALLLPLAENCGAGRPIHIDLLTDQIKEARREDDDRLSQGVWRIKHKKADWPLVIDLCEQALAEQSKDLNVLGWLIEAWTMKDGLAGCIRGITLLHAFCEKFWPILFPNAITVHLDEYTSDVEYTDQVQIESTINEHLLHPGKDESAHKVAERRQFIFDWIDKTVQNSLLFITLSPSNDLISAAPLTLARWIDALDFEKKIKRAPNLAIQKHENTIADYRRLLSLAPLPPLIELLEATDTLRQAVTFLCDLLETLDLTHTVQFTQTKKRLQEIEHILSQTMATRQAEEENNTRLQKMSQPLSNLAVSEASNFDMPTTIPLEADPTVISEPHKAHSSNDTAETQIISQREDAYRAIKEIGIFLMQIDPHSPAPYLLELIGSWESKNLLQIVQDINSGNSDAHELFKLLARKTIEKD